ncbi:MAG: transposase [Verrucomicrobiota bacterium]
MKPCIPIKGHSQLRKGRFSLGGASYFLTLCARGQPSDLARDAIFGRLMELVAALDREQVMSVRAMTLMPDHLHAIVRLGDAAALSDAIRLFKGRASVILRQAEMRWQKGGYYDHRLRAGEPLAPVFRYIFMNPYWAGLCQGGQKWPFFRCCRQDWEWFQHDLNNEMPYPEWLR